MLKRLKTAYSKKKLKDQNYHYLFDVPPDECWVCFDCETTGLNVKKDQILSLSAIKIRKNEILTSEALNLRFKASEAINPQSILIHGLRNMDMTEGEEHRLAMDKFLQFIGSRPLVGYFLEFDVAMVNSVIKPWLGIELPNQQLDISSLFSKLYYKPWLQQEHEVFDLSFNNMLKKCEVPMLPAHDAYNDALMTAMLYVKMQKKLTHR